MEIILYISIQTSSRYIKYAVQIHIYVYQIRENSSVTATNKLFKLPKNIDKIYRPYQLFIILLPTVKR